jgi:surface protein
MFVGVGIGVGRQRFAGGGDIILPFQFTINTNSTSAGSTSNNQFQLPLSNVVSPITPNFTIYWGDGSSDFVNSFTSPIHTYSTIGIYTITIEGDISGIKFNNTGDRLKMFNVISWGTRTNLGSTSNTIQASDFYGCGNLTSNATDSPILVGSLQSMFRGCILLNGGISNWNTSQVKSMNGVFRAATLFNQNIGNWDVGNVIDFSNMFLSNTVFNNGGSSSINNWNTSNATNMTQLFLNVSAFNQPIGNWDVSKVAVGQFGNFINNPSYSHLDNIYNGWSTKTLIPNNSVSFGTAKYTSEGVAGRAILTSPPNNWTITDGGLL